MSEQSKIQTGGILLLFGMLAGGLFSQSVLGDPLVAPLLLKEAGLTQQWEVQLPIKPEETVDRMFVFDKYLLILSDKNYLFCRNRADGSYRFGMPLAKTRLPVCNPLFVDGKVLFLIGRELLVIDPGIGQVVRKAFLTNVENNTQCSLSKNDTYLYIAGVDKRLHAYQVSPTDYIQIFTATADDDSVITSVAAVEDQVYFTTESGNIVAISSKGPVKIWQYNASGPITAPLVLDDLSLYVGSEDTKVYKLDAETGRMEWDVPFFAGDKIRTSPVAGQEVLYQYAGSSGVYAIDKLSGQSVWNVPNGRNLLCESGNTAYIYAQPGILVVMDNASGEERYSLNMAQVQRSAINQADATMYLADEKGRVAAVAVP